MSLLQSAQTSSRTYIASCTLHMSALSLVVKGPGVKLTTDQHLMPRLRMSEVKSQLSKCFYGISCLYGMPNQGLGGEVQPVLIGKVETLPCPSNSHVTS
jgi:hypothetical protein